MNVCARRMWVLVAALTLAAGVVSAEEKPRAAPAAALEKQARGAIDRGVKFLKSKVQPDGSWSREPGVSGMVVLALLKSGCGTDDPVVAKSVAYLVKLQKADGGIYGRRLANYTTAVAVQVLTSTNDRRYRANILKARAFLVGAQLDEPEGHGKDDAAYGGLDYGGTGRGAGRADLSNTQMWADAMKELENAGLKRDSKAWKKMEVFVSRCQNRSESNDQKWASNDGGATYGPFENRQYAVQLADGRTGLRSYGSMTYAFLKTMVYADVKKDDPRVQAACDWIRKHYTVEENPELGQQGLFYYYHTMAKALSAMGEPTLVDEKGVAHDWRSDLTRKILSLQQDDGSWVNKNDRWWESDPVLVTAYGVLTLGELLEK